MRRPLLTFALLVLLIAGFASLAGMSLRQALGAKDEVISELRGELLLLQEAATQEQISARSARSFLLTRDPRFLDSLRQARARLHELGVALRSHAPSAAEASRLDRLMRAHAALEVQMDALISASGDGATMEELGRRLETEVQPKQDAVDALFAESIRARQEAVTGAERTAAATAARAYRILVTIAAASVALALLFAFWWWRTLGRLRRQNEVLEQALGGLRTNQEFVQQVTSIVGHDLRSPLAALLATASHLLSRGDLSAAQTRSVERIARSGARIRHLLQTLLDFTHSRHDGRLPLARRASDLHVIASRVVEAFQTLHPDHVIRHRPEGDASALIDTDRVTQIAWNLVDNAVRYSPVGSVIEVHSRSAGQGVLLEVHNEGPPIPRALQEGLFEPFQRGAQEEATVRLSLGLGLYLVRQMVAAHGGQIHVTSNEEHGTTFTVWLPTGAGAPERPSDVAASTQVAPSLPS